MPGHTPIPDVVVSRDGRRAVALDELDSEWFRAGSRASLYVVGTVRLEPRAEPHLAKIEAAHLFRTMWDQPKQTIRWPEAFSQAFPELALIALGEFLDRCDVPLAPEEERYVLTAHVNGDLFDVLKRGVSTDAELLQYAKAKIYWAWRFKFDSAPFNRSDAVRFGVSPEDLSHAAFRHTGILWDGIGPNRFRARPALLDHFEHELRSSITSELPSTYDVALSFAGEQRQYVKQVAELLRAAGVRVFYDDFEDLWGKDLPVRLEEVYRRQARFVVVFVSAEYVTKAWPNLERQHALAGRLERMDDSVLPARVDHRFSRQGKRV
jgi:hypothetical protein